MRDSPVCVCGRGVGRGTLYDVLQVSPWCEPEVIQAAYRALARSRHPDVNRDSDAEDQMRRLNVAYQTLSDPARRLRYDEELALEAARPVPLRPAPAPVPTPTPAPRPAPASAATATGPRPAGPRPFGTGSAGPQPVGARPVGARPAGAGPRPAANGFHAAAPHPSGARPAASPAPGPRAGVDAQSGPNYAAAYGATIFETGGTMLLPRSAVYVSLVLVLVILALVAWLILDTLAERPNAPVRLQQYGYVQPVGAPSPRFAERVSLLADATTEPGLSRLSARWNV